MNKFTGKNGIYYFKAKSVKFELFRDLE